MDEALQSSMKRLRELRARYMDAHRAGMAALERHDLAGLAEAIERETEILNEQRALIDLVRGAAPRTNQR